MKGLFRKIYNSIGKFYLSPLLKAEIRKRPFPIINERSTEYNFALKHISNRCQGKLLDVGPGKSSWPHLLSTCGIEVTAVDKIKGYWNNFFNRHYDIINGDITKTHYSESFQFVTCISVLEHIPDHINAVQNMWKSLEKKGYLILTFPYNENVYHEDIYSHPESGYGKGSNFVTQVYSRKEIDSWLKGTSLKIIEQVYFDAFTGDFWTFGERKWPIKKVEKSDPHHLTCLLFQKE